VIANDRELKLRDIVTTKFDQPIPLFGVLLALPLLAVPNASEPSRTAAHCSGELTLTCRGGDCCSVLFGVRQPLSRPLKDIRFRSSRWALRAVRLTLCS
jgi:hypothetical protein